MSVVFAAAAPMAAEPVEQAVQHYSRMRLIPAVPAEVAARAALLVSSASATLVARSARHRLSALLLVFAAVAAEAASECAAAEAGAVAAVPVEQAVQHYSRTWLIAAVAAEVAARASATLALLVLSRGQALTPQRL